MQVAIVRVLASLSNHLLRRWRDFFQPTQRAAGIPERIDAVSRTGRREIFCEDERGEVEKVFPPARA